MFRPGTSNRILVCSSGFTNFSPLIDEDALTMCKYQTKWIFKALPESPTSIDRVSACPVADTICCLPNSYLSPLLPGRDPHPLPACKLSKPFWVVIRGPVNGGMPESPLGSLRNISRWNPKNLQVGINRLVKIKSPGLAINTCDSPTHESCRYLRTCRCLELLITKSK